MKGLINMLETKYNHLDVEKDKYDLWKENFK